MAQSAEDAMEAEAEMKQSLIQQPEQEDAALNQELDKDEAQRATENSGISGFFKKVGRGITSFFSSE